MSCLCVVFMSCLCVIIQIVMNSNKTVQDYDRRLRQLPQISKQIQEQIRNLSSLVQGQQSQINTQNVKIRLMQQEMGKLDKVIETRENEIQELTESEEKSAQKEKKYFMQIENYNKKIEGLKGESAKTQKNIQLIKKQIKVIESTTGTATSQKNKILQHLTKGQLKINSLTQNLNDLKMKVMEKGSRKEQTVDSSKRDEKQLNDLFLAIKKQMQMIDVLKKQKVHLMASTIFKYCEQDFAKLLEVNKEG